MQRLVIIIVRVAVHVLMVRRHHRALHVLAVHRGHVVHRCEVGGVDQRVGERGIMLSDGATARHLVHEDTGEFLDVAAAVKLRSRRGLAGRHGLIDVAQGVRSAADPHAQLDDERPDRDEENETANHAETLRVNGCGREARGRAPKDMERSHEENRSDDAEAVNIAADEEKQGSTCTNEIAHSAFHLLNFRCLFEWVCHHGRWHVDGRANGVNTFCKLHVRSIDYTGDGAAAILCGSSSVGLWIHHVLLRGCSALL
eukprot:6163729-Pleurochrysis_carterae.AAC.4